MLQIVFNQITRNNVWCLRGYAAESRTNSDKKWFLLYSVRTSINFSGCHGCCVFVFFLCVVMAVDAVMVGKFSLGPRVSSGHYNKQVWDPPEKVGVLKYLIKHPTTLTEMRNTIINYFSLNGKLAKFGRCNNQHLTTNTILGDLLKITVFKVTCCPPKHFEITLIRWKPWGVEYNVRFRCLSAPREINKLLKFHRGSFYACPGPRRK